MTQITKNDAIIIASQKIKEIESQIKQELTLILEETIEIECGWVFFYNSEKYHQTKDFRYQLAGNSPFIVNSRNGSIFPSSSAEAIDKFIERYHSIKST